MAKHAHQKIEKTVSEGISVLTMSQKTQHRYGNNKKKPFFFFLPTLGVDSVLRMSITAP